MPPKRRGRPRRNSTAPAAASASAAKLEFRASDDDAWYSVRLQMEAGETLRVMYYEFPESADERFAADQFGSASEVEAFGGRFRLDSVPLEDCRMVEAGMRVCGFCELSDREKRFHDAVVDSVSRADGEGKCLCRFELLWQHGTLATTKTPVGIESIYLIQSGGPQVDPILEHFLDVAKERVRVQNSEARSISESPRNGVEPMSWGNDSSGMKESMKSQSSARNPKVTTLKANVKNTFSGGKNRKSAQDIDLGSSIKRNNIGCPKCHYFLQITNLEKDLSPACIMDFIYEQTSISSVAVILPELSSEFYSTGTIFVETQEKASKLSKFLFNPLRIIMSLRGRPWVLSQKWYGSMEGKMPKIEDQPWTGKREHLTKLKLVTADSKEYVMGMKILEVYKEFYEHIEGLHQALETEREQIEGLHQALETEREQIASKLAFQEKHNYLRR